MTAPHSIPAPPDLDLALIDLLRAGQALCAVAEAYQQRTRDDLRRGEAARARDGWIDASRALAAAIDGWYGALDGATDPEGRA